MARHSAAHARIFVRVFAALFTKDNQGLAAIVTYLLEENAILRRRIDGRIRFTDHERRTLAAVAHEIPRDKLEQLTTLVTPDTLMKWFRELVAKKYTAKRAETPGPGRPELDPEVVQLILDLSAENRSWGYERIRGELMKLGHKVSKSTVRNVLERHATPPAPDRNKRTWSQFLREQIAALAASDFFTVEAITPKGLRRFLVYFVIHHQTRRVHIAGVHTAHGADGEWMAQIARNVTDAEDGVLKGKTKLIIDRDPLYTEKFRAILESGGVETVRLPPSSPNLNAIAERFVRSVREECLDQILIFGEAQLRRVLSEYESYFNEERPHQGIGNVRIVEPEPRGCEAEARAGPVVKRERLGGLLRSYSRVPRKAA